MCVCVFIFCLSVHLLRLLPAFAWGEWCRWLCRPSGKPEFSLRLRALQESPAFPAPAPPLPELTSHSSLPELTSHCSLPPLVLLQEHQPPSVCWLGRARTCSYFVCIEFWLMNSLPPDKLLIYSCFQSFAQLSRVWGGAAWPDHLKHAALPTHSQFVCLFVLPWSIFPHSTYFLKYCLIYLFIIHILYHTYFSPAGM